MTTNILNTLNKFWVNATRPGLSNIPCMDYFSSANNTLNFNKETPKVQQVKDSDGNIYEGDFKDGKPNGYGKLNYSSGNTYEGMFKGGKFHGNGTYTFSKGEFKKYEGEFKNGMFNGKGKLVFDNDVIYDGYFEDHKFNGKAILTHPDGTKAECAFENGLPVGQQNITFISANGDTNKFNCRFKLEVAHL